MIVVTMFFIIFGAIGIYSAEGMTFSDALWWSFVTTTTVGYGDLSPATNIGRIIAVILMLIGIGLVGSLTSTITTYFLNTEKENKSYKDEILQTIKQKIDDFDNLTSDDIEDICKTLKALKKE
jgi:voltage-gated potassium channel